MERYSFMEAHIDDRFYMDFSRRREPDCFINVYRDDDKPSGQHISHLHWETQRDADEAFHNAGKVGIYRLRVYLKRRKPDV